MNIKFQVLIQDNVGLLVLKTIVWKMTHVCEGIFQVWPFGTDLWDKTFNFEGNVGLLVLKMIVWKKTATICEEFFNSDH